MFTAANLQRITVCAVAAIVLTTASVSAAVGPARAVETGPLLAAAEMAPARG